MTPATSTTNTLLTFFFLFLTLPQFLSATSLTLKNSSKAIPSTKSGSPSTNIYSSNPIFVNPPYRRNLRNTINGSPPSERPILQRYLKAPTAIWLTKEISHTSPTSRSTVRSALNAAIRQGTRKHGGKTPVVTFVLYNLPNRDCGAGASSGDACCHRDGGGRCDIFKHTGSCENGVQEYADKFINPLTGIVKKFCNRVPMSFVVEPDALSYLVTNTDEPACGTSTQAGYKAGIKLAVSKIRQACPQASIYVDAGNPSWLGWKSNTEKFLSIIEEMDIAHLIRGFSINVSAYDELGSVCSDVGICQPNQPGVEKCCSHDSCGWRSSWNVGFNCATYAQSLVQTARNTISGFDPRILVDTSRNGVANARTSCTNWCNIRRAGVGQFPSGRTMDERVIDAYMWVKPPGESDGCTRRTPNGGTCSRLAGNCESADAWGSAPEAGDWFPEAVRSMMKNGVRPSA